MARYLGEKVDAEHQRELPSHGSTRNFQRTRSRSGGNNNPWTELCIRVQTVGPRITGSNTLGQSRTNELNMSSESNDGARGLIIRANGSVEDFTYTGYESLRVGVGGSIECVTTSVWRIDDSNEVIDLWGNEEARLFRAPNNVVAQRIVARMSARPIEEILTLHGDFVLLSSNSEGDTIGLPESAIEYYRDFAIEEEEAVKHQGERDEPFTRVVGVETPIGQRMSHLESRKEHMEWAKGRANEYLDNGNRWEAIASFGSDLGKHPETAPLQQMIVMYSMMVPDDDIEGTRRFINDFN